MVAEIVGKLSFCHTSGKVNIGIAGDWVGQVLRLSTAPSGRKGLEDTMKRIHWLPLIAVTSIGAFGGLAANPAAEAFRKLADLAGHWEGKDNQGSPVKSTFKLVVSETAVMETLSPGRMEEMMTLYSVDGDAIALLHYCPTNNQPRMRATPPPGEIKELVFTFQGAGNLRTPETGHEHKLVMEFQDKDHIVERWTWRKNGQDTEMVYRLARKSGASRTAKGSKR